MSLEHSAFLFDYHAFQTATVSLVAALDAGDQGPLQARVSQIRQEVGLPRNWILHDKGTDMGDFGLDRDPRFQDSLWGNWLLTILSTFLHPCVSLGYDWTKLTHILRNFKWDEQDIELVIAGLPTVWLLKPEAPYKRDQYGVPMIEKPPPYWYLMGPNRSTYSGWLPVEEVARLRQQLLADQHLLKGDIRTRIQLPPGISAETAYISKELDPNYWYERIPIVYQQAIEMMSRALDAGVGLFSVVYQAYGDPEEWERDETDEDQS